PRRSHRAVHERSDPHRAARARRVRESAAAEAVQGLDLQAGDLHGARPRAARSRGWRGEMVAGSRERAPSGGLISLRGVKRLPVAFLSLALLSVVAGTACAQTFGNTAAVVNGSRITQKQLDQELPIVRAGQGASLSDEDA